MARIRANLQPDVDGSHRTFAVTEKIVRGQRFPSLDVATAEYRAHQLFQHIRILVASFFLLYSGLFNPGSRRKLSVCVDHVVFLLQLAVGLSACVKYTQMVQGSYERIADEEQVQRPKQESGKPPVEAGNGSRPETSVEAGTTTTRHSQSAATSPIIALGH